MKTFDTQHLFYKQYPYKVTVTLPYQHNGSALHYINNNEKWPDYLKRTSENKKIRATFKKWCQDNLSQFGSRSEGNVFSVFLATAEDVQILMDNCQHEILNFWRPKNENAAALLSSHLNDIVRDHPWYSKFYLRAKISYTREFMTHGLLPLQVALNGIAADEWHASGLLGKLLSHPRTTYGYCGGQLFNLYLKNEEDALLLRLHCGQYISKFERIRAP